MKKFARKFDVSGALPRAIRASLLLALQLSADDSLCLV